MKSFADHNDQLRNYELEIQEFSFLTKDTHILKKLGTAYNTTIWLFEAKNSNGVLASSGWQGDEPAGWHASKVLCKKLPEVSFIPFVSPGCFLTRQHRNYEGKNVDRGWPNILTVEGEVLESNLSEIVRLGSKCFISMQEDPKRFIPYFYGWEEDAIIDDIIQRKITSHFPLSTNSKFVSKPGMFCEHMIQNGCSMAIQIETPADGSYPLAKRIDCQVDVVKSLIREI